MLDRLGENAYNTQISVLRQVVRVDPVSNRPVEQLLVDQFIPTPDGFLDVLEYRNRYNDFTFDYKGDVIVPPRASGGTCKDYHVAR